MRMTRVKKYEYFNHFIARFMLEGVGGGYGPTRKITGRRLWKAMGAILKDRALWSDILIRHNGLNVTPEEMQGQCTPAYEHCLGNFWAMVNSIMAELGII